MEMGRSGLCTQYVNLDGDSSSSVMICVLLLLWLVVVKAVIMSGVALGAS